MNTQLPADTRAKIEEFLGRSNNPKALILALRIGAASIERRLYIKIIIFRPRNVAVGLANKSSYSGSFREAQEWTRFIWSKEPEMKMFDATTENLLQEFAHRGAISKGELSISLESLQ